jgi:hypothetical protein
MRRTTIQDHIACNCSRGASARHRGPRSAETLLGFEKIPFDAAGKPAELTKYGDILTGLVKLRTSAVTEVGTAKPHRPAGTFSFDGTHSSSASLRDSLGAG